jgi:predicted RNA polymerase sigma factor
MLIFTRAAVLGWDLLFLRVAPGPAGPKRELPSRLEAVLEAIYAGYGIGWDDMAGIDQRARDLTEEAI